MRRKPSVAARPTRRHLLTAAAGAGLSTLLGGCSLGGLSGWVGSIFDDLEPGGEGYAIYRARKGDTLIELARRFRLGYVELAAANPGIDPWLPPPGAPLVIPTTRLLPRGRREGLLVNLADMRLYHFPDPSLPHAHYPIGIGREGYLTPLGATRVVKKTADPTWYPPASVRADKPVLPPAGLPGPDNPLGSHALYLAWPSYLIHGTNIPWSIGRHASNGCVRLYPEHIPALYASVPIGARVTVVHEPIKLGWIGDELYMEAHPSLRQADEIEDRRSFTPEVPKGIMKRIAREAGKAAGRIDWELAKQTVLERRGYAVRLTLA